MCNLARLAIVVVAFSSPVHAEGDELATQKDAWQRLQRQLSTRVSLNVDQAPLDDVLYVLSVQAGVKIVIDQAGLDDLGIELTDEASISADSLQAEVVLDLLLESVDLAWTVRNDLVVVTSQEVASETLVTRVYLAPDLLRDVDSRQDYDSLIDVIISTISSDSWVENGGPEAEIRPLAASNALVISQTPRTHWQIEQLLFDVRKLRERQGLPVASSGRNANTPTNDAYIHKTYLTPTTQTLLPREYR